MPSICLLLRSSFCLVTYHKGLIDGVWLSFWQVIPSLWRTAESLLKWSLGSQSPSLPKPVYPGYWVCSQTQSPTASKRIPFHIDGAHCAPGNVQSFSNGFIPLPRSMSQQYLIMEVCGEFLGYHGLVFGQMCIVNCGTLQTQMCAFLNYVFKACTHQIRHEIELRCKNVKKSVCDIFTWRMHTASDANF